MMPAPENEMAAKHIDTVAIGFSRGRGIVSRAIQKMDDSYFNHVFMAFRFQNVSLIYESHIDHGVQLSPFSHIMSAMLDGKVETFELHWLKQLTETQKLSIWNNCAKLHGKPYDAREILVYYLWIRICKRKGDAPDTFNKRGKYTCNELVVSACRNNVAQLAGTTYKDTPESLFRILYGKPSKQLIKKRC